MKVKHEDTTCALRTEGSPKLLLMLFSQQMNVIVGEIRRCVSVCASVRLVCLLGSSLLNEGVL